MMCMACMTHRGDSTKIRHNYLPNKFKQMPIWTVTVSTCLRMHILSIVWFSCHRVVGTPLLSLEASQCQCGVKVSTQRPHWTTRLQILWKCGRHWKSGREQCITTVLHFLNDRSGFVDARSQSQRPRCGRQECRVSWQAEQRGRAGMPLCVSHHQFGISSKKLGSCQPALWHWPHWRTRVHSVTTRRWRWKSWDATINQPSALFWFWHDDWKSCWWICGVLDENVVMNLERKTVRDFMINLAKLFEKSYENISWEILSVRTHAQVPAQVLPQMRNLINEKIASSVSNESWEFSMMPLQRT